MAKQAGRPAPAAPRERPGSDEKVGGPSGGPQGKREGGKGGAGHKKALTGRQKAAVFLVTLRPGARVSRRAGQWKRRHELDALAFSSTHRRILRLLEPATDG